MEKIEFEPEIFHKLTSRAHELFFSHYVLHLVRDQGFFFFFHLEGHGKWKIMYKLIHK